MKTVKSIFLVLIAGLWFCPLFGEEGMIPLSELDRFDLQKKGLKIAIEDIYNPDAPGLIDAICIVGGGCTGSFISDRGLILTNHHCAFGAVQSASTEKQDYLTKGFCAPTREAEISAPGYTIRITESYRDVSSQVLAGLSPGMDYKERREVLERTMKEIVARVEKESPGKRAEVSEMFKGRTYVLFVYTYLKDVRMVYIPPRSIGNFGGEIDNWEWPRHTGDFSLLRAYVGPDGKPADYDPANIPYRPKKHLRVAGGGCREGDFVFILGYPGRTFTHKTSHFLEYQQRTLMPLTIDIYEQIIGILEQKSQTSREVAIRNAGLIKGLANVAKKYRGRLKAMERVGMIEQKREEERQLLRFIRSRPELESRYGNLLAEIDTFYERQTRLFLRSIIFQNFRRSLAFRLAFTAVQAAEERKKDDLDRESPYMDRNYERTVDRLLRSTRDFHGPSDRAVLTALLERDRDRPPSHRIPYLQATLYAPPPVTIASFVESLYRTTRVHEREFLQDLLDGKIPDPKDPFLELAGKLLPFYSQIRDEEKELQGINDALSARLLEVKKLFAGQQFIPDANGTLRLTYGKVKGYSPRDGEFRKPFTTLRGIREKAGAEPPFNAPPKLLEEIRKLNPADSGSLYYPEYRSIPVCMLYDTHTTGGNSGSPVLNGSGELVGLNFDRCFEGTINDFGWFSAYSRSIGVDIRYVLWILKEFAETGALLREITGEPRPGAI